MNKATFVNEIPNEIKGNEVPTLNLVKTMIPEGLTPEDGLSPFKCEYTSFDTNLFEQKGNKLVLKDLDGMKSYKICIWDSIGSEQTFASNSPSQNLELNGFTYRSTPTSFEMEAKYVDYPSVYELGLTQVEITNNENKIVIGMMDLLSNYFDYDESSQIYTLKSDYTDFSLNVSYSLKNKNNGYMYYNVQIDKSLNGKTGIFSDSSSSGGTTRLYAQISSEGQLQIVGAESKSVYTNCICLYGSLTKSDGSKLILVNPKIKVSVSKSDVVNGYPTYELVNQMIQGYVKSKIQSLESRIKALEGKI